MHHSQSQTQAYCRKTVPGVRGGRVLRKNRRATSGQHCFVDQHRPIEGFRHVVTRRDIYYFISLIADWNSVGLDIDQVVLTSGDDSWEGCYEYDSWSESGTIRLAAWSRDFHYTMGAEWFNEHQWLFDILGVPYWETNDGWACGFNRRQAKAYMLLHVFMHEVGHHVDLLRTPHRRCCAGGEIFAENYANRWFDCLWKPYVKLFGSPDR